jgi:DNA-binding PadR family transcriptional regulator
MAYDRLQSKITKGNLWLYILKLLWDKTMYAYDINKKIKANFHFTTATVTVYVVLYKMRREGLIKMIGERQVHNKRIRKYYEITEKGRENFFKGIELLKNTIQFLE